MEIGNTKRGTQGIVKTDDPVAHLVENGTAHSVVIPVVKKHYTPGAVTVISKELLFPHAVPILLCVRPWMQ